MKIARILLLFMVLCASSCLAFADATTDSLLAAIAKQGRVDKLSSQKMPLMAVDLGDKCYVCRLSDGHLMKTSPSKNPGISVVGDWANVHTTPLDAKSHPAAQGAGWLMHRSGGIWRLVAVNEGVGFSKEALRKAKVPSDIIAKLKVEVAE